MMGTEDKHHVDVLWDRIVSIAGSWLTSLLWKSNRFEKLRVLNF
jgi:hypothetical protein